MGSGSGLGPGRGLVLGWVPVSDLEWVSVSDRELENYPVAVRQVSGAEAVPADYYSGPDRPSRRALRIVPSLLNGAEKSRACADFLESGLVLQ